MSEPITNNFAVEITGLQNTIEGTKLFADLCANVVHWERDFKEDDEEENDTSYLVNEAEGDEDSDDDSDEESEDDEEEFTVEDTAESELSLTVRVTPEVLRDIKALQDTESAEPLTLSIIYGTAPRTLIRQFTISPDVAVLLSEGGRDDNQLHVVVVADVFDSETIF